jgi:hypothetical protein
MRPSYIEPRCRARSYGQPPETSSRPALIPSYQINITINGRGGIDWRAGSTRQSSSFQESGLRAFRLWRCGDVGANCGCTSTASLEARQSINAGRNRRRFRSEDIAISALSQSSISLRRIEVCIMACTTSLIGCAEATKFSGPLRYCVF